jgi:hypothetical protein
MAAHLEGIAEPSGICLSNAAYEQVRDKLKEELIDLGECSRSWAKPFVRFAHMSLFSGAESGRTLLPPRRQVTIGRDGEDFVVSFQPHNIVVFRHNEADPLRKICHSLGWEIVSDTAPNLASWCRIESHRLTR